MNQSNSAVADQSYSSNSTTSPILSQVIPVMGPKKLERILQSETQRISRFDGIQSLEVLSEKIDGKEAEVRVRVTYGNGKKEERNITLTWIDGSWKITPGGK